MRGRTSLERLGQDLRYALRTPSKSPGFTTVAVLSLALGIGANTAIFTFVNAALLKPLPYPDAGRIVALEQRPLTSQMRKVVSTPTTPVHPRSFVPWHDRSKSFEALAIAQPVPVNIQGPDGTTEQVPGLWATPELFRVFRVAPMLGRVFSDQEGFGRAEVRGETSGTSVIVLSHGYWQHRFGGDPSVVGKTMPIGQGAAVVIGVMPPGFRVGTLDVDVYTPIRIDRGKPDAVGSRSFLCFGLLRNGVSLESARAEMDVIGSQVGREDQNERDFGVVISSLHDYLVRDTRPVLLVLAGVVVFVLLIACANLAGLLLTRGVGRQSELALRASLGASRRRLIEQLFVESVALSALGGTLGVLLGSLTSRILVFLARDAVAFGQMAEVHLDWRVVTFAIVITLFTAVVFGLAPAWQAARADLNTGLQSPGRSGTSRSQRRLRSTLIVGEVALAAVLLVGAGLLLRTFFQLITVNLGFQPEQALTMRMLLMGQPAVRSNLVESILDRVESLPGVNAVGTIQFLPLAGHTNNGPFHFVGRPQNADSMSSESDVSTVSRGYFAAMGIPVLRGRPFGRQDRLDGPRVALVNESFVKRYSADEDPIGRVILGDWANPKPTEIIGVVGDIRHNGLTAEPRPTVFLAQSQVPGYYTYIIVRTAMEPTRLAATVRREIQQVDPREPVTTVQP